MNILSLTVPDLYAWFKKLVQYALILQISAKMLEQFSINWVSKVIRNCFDFALLRSVMGLKNSRHLHVLNQSNIKPKPIATWSHAFSHARRRLRLFASSFHSFGSLCCLRLLWLAILIALAIKNQLLWLGFYGFHTQHEHLSMYNDCRYSLKYPKGFQFL